MPGGQRRQQRELTRDGRAGDDLRERVAVAPWGVTAAEKATVEAARTARLATRAGVDPAELEAIDPEAVFEPVIDDATQLAAAGIDVPAGEPTPARGDRRSTLLGLIDELDAPTREAVLAGAEAAGLDPAAAATLLDRLHREGALTRRDGRYRVL